MTNPWEAYFAMQLALYQGWLHLMFEGLEANRRLFEHQMELMHHLPLHRWHDVSPRGADWFDHYGHRLHDVDIERV